MPGPTDVTVEVIPVTPSDELDVGVAADFTLGHCGLISPIDIDGSLWDPVGSSAPLTDDQRGELINATPTVVTLESEDRMVMRTPLGAEIVLARHDGPREYFLCD